MHEANLTTPDTARGTNGKQLTTAVMQISEVEFRRFAYRV